MTGQVGGTIRCTDDPDLMDHLDRRRHPRLPLAVPIRVWLTQELLIGGSTTNASLGGVRVKISRRAPDGFLRRGRRYLVEIRRGGRWFRRFAEIRDVAASGIGLKLLRPLLSPLLP